jgi:hypothetical protein
MPSTRRSYRNSPGGSKAKNFSRPFLLTTSFDPNCSLCSGTGWRPLIEGQRSPVTRCICRGARKQPNLISGRDRKMDAAGGDR